MNSILVSEEQINLLVILSTSHSDPGMTTAENTGYWLRTYQALESRGLIRPVFQTGYLLNPKRNITWIVTPLGGELLRVMGKQFNPVYELRIVVEKEIYDKVSNLARGAHLSMDQTVGTLLEKGLA